MTSLTNKTALVTGGSRGMGRATALALAAAGARVIVHYGRNADEAKSVVGQIRAAGGRADAIAADLAAADRAHRLAAQVRRLIGDRLDIVVSNAGISNAAGFEDITVEDFDNLFAVNVCAPYFLLQQLLPMLGSGSAIVFLSSLGARTAVGALAAYASTKGAINTLVKYFAAALGARHPRQRGRTGRDRHGHVELHQDRRRPRRRHGNAEPQANRHARRRGFGHRLPGLGRGALDHRRHRRRRRRLEALKGPPNSFFDLGGAKDEHLHRMFRAIRRNDDSEKSHPALGAQCCPELK